MKVDNNPSYFSNQLPTCKTLQKKKKTQQNYLQTLKAATFRRSSDHDVLLINIKSIRQPALCN